MQLPTVPTTLRDEENDVNYVVMAYRPLAREELIQAVRFYRSTKQGKKKVKQHSKITIISTIGA